MSFSPEEYMRPLREKAINTATKIVQDSVVQAAQATANEEQNNFNQRQQAVKESALAKQKVNDENRKQQKLEYDKKKKSKTTTIPVTTTS